MTPHIGVDLRIADPAGMVRSGLGRYAIELADGLIAGRPDWRFSVYSNQVEGAVRTRWPTGSALGRVVWLHAGSWADVRRDPPDVWVSPAYVTPAWWRGRSVVTVHDLSFLEMPERYRGRPNAWHALTQTRRSTRRATWVTCGTLATAERVTAALGVPAERISVVRYGVSEVFRRTDVPADPPYVLYVGTFEARKGLEVLLSAMEGLDLQLVLAGGPGWGASETVAAAAARPWVRIVEDPDDETVAALYAGALACVYPSRREGFGLPVAEAMAAGCPVVASALPEIQEWAGDAPVWVPVGSAPAIADAVRWLSDPDERARRVAAGRAVAGELTWERTAEGVAALIEAALA